VDLRFRCSAPPFLPVSGPFMPITHSHYLLILFNLISPPFPRSTPLSYSFQRSLRTQFASLADFNIWRIWSLQNKLKINCTVCMKKL
jgi:hypothetical protein